MADISNGYPKRPKFFACKFTRRMGKVCLGNDLGPDVCWMLAFIVSTEDAKGYRSPVSFYNEDLATRTGLSLAGMKRARDKAVQAGWLCYEQGAKGRAARYYVTVPPWADEMDDGPGDERPGELSGRIVAHPEPESELHPDGIRTECEPPSSLPRSLPSEAVGATAPTTTSEPRTQPKPKPAKPTPESDSRFVQFWSAYPRRENKTGAARALAKIDPDPELFAVILKAVEAQKRRGGSLEPRTDRDGRSVVPHPATWLNARRWEDDPPDGPESVAVTTGDPPRIRRGTDNAMASDAVLSTTYPEMELPNGSGC